MSDEDLDDGAWGEPMLEPPFEGDAPADEPATPMDLGTDDIFGMAHEAGAAAAAAAIDAAATAEQATLGLALDVAELLDALAQLDDKVPYGFGSKPSNLKLTPAELLIDRKAPKGIDCSGFVRWLLYRASNGKVKIPDGSWNQRDHFRALADVAHLPASAYAACGKTDGIVRVAGFVRSAKVSVGHIWLVHDGQTIESHGGKGINRRPWNQSSLVRLATWCYPLARRPG
jgi:cell wall-associated NlpC family hydrolase